MQDESRAAAMVVACGGLDAARREQRIEAGGRDVGVTQVVFAQWDEEPRGAASGLDGGEVARRAVDEDAG